MKLNPTNKNTLKAIAIVFLMLCALAAMRTSNYQTVEIETTNEGSLFDLESKPSCLGNSYYSDSRGGVCGGQQLVKEQSSYKMK